MRKFLLVIIMILLFIAGLYSPWDKLTLEKIAGVRQEKRFSSLIFTSLAGEVEVVVDLEVKGSAIFSKGPLVINGIEEGTHKVTLKRKSENGFYDPLVKEISFEEGLGTIMVYEVGPTTSSSMGYVLSPLDGGVEEDRIGLSFTGVSPDTRLIHNGRSSTPSELTAIDPALKHELRFTENGFLPLDVELGWRENVSSLYGKKIQVDINMFKIPVEIEENDAKTEA